MKIRFAVVVASLALTAFGCANESADPSGAEDVQHAEQSLVKQLNGKFKFVFDDARRAAVFADLESRLSGEALATAKREADEEADVSVLEFDDGRFVSWIGDKAIADMRYEAKEQGPDSLLITMGEKTTTLEFADADTIVIHDPKKGELTFERIK
ncbi:MAG: hypothetical protein JNK04_06350 [Myxococcales bacterium]|nr:hypothetical protein [Myxococcales bacterium]